MFSIVRRGATTTLRGPEGKYSTYTPKRIFTGMGWDAQSAAALLVRDPHQALLLGLGGGTVARQLRAMYPRVAITGVEIDEAIASAAKSHFHIELTEVTCVVGSGEDFIDRTPGRFDFIFDDMWDHNRHRRRAVRSGLNWFDRVQRCLTPRGLYAAGIYRRSEDRRGYDQVLRRFRAAFRSVAEVRLPHETVTVIAGMQDPSLERIARRIRARPASTWNWLKSVEFLDRTFVC